MPSPNQPIKQSLSLKQAILIAVRTHTGIRDQELELDVMGLLGPFSYNNDQYNNELIRLIDSGDVVKFEFNIPPIGIKTIYFPELTTLND